MLNTESAALKQFIKNFDFEKPDWSHLPQGFLFRDTSNLNKEERSLYSGIVFAWIVYRSEVLNEEVFQEKIRQNALVNNLYLTGKILFYLLIFILITGNLINYFLIEIYHSIL